MPEWAGIVLAAGKGVRMKSRVPKVLHTVCGVPLLGHVTGAMRSAGLERIVVVGSPESSETPEFTGAAGQGSVVAVQREQLGTADAVAAAQDATQQAGQVLVGAGDMALIQPASIKRMMESHAATDAAVTVLTAAVGDPAGFGRIIRDGDGAVSAIVEEKVADDETRQINEINTSWYCFDAAWLWERISGVQKSATGEFFLTDLVAEAARSGRVGAVAVGDPAEAMGVNDRTQLAAVEREMTQRILTSLMLSGVTVRDPSSTYVDAGVTIGRDTVLLPGVHLRAGTSVGEACEIGPNSNLSKSQIGDRVRIISSYVDGATIGDDLSVGPYSRIRPGTVIETGAYIGNYAEIKNSRIGAGSAVGHFSYVGDTDVGRDVNIGAGTVTANYDGVAKHRTRIGDGAFIGSDSIIIAPRNIGARARTAAGAVITSDVADGETVAGVPARPIGEKNHARSERAQG